MLDDNETPDCLNVVFDERGGFKTRKGFKEVAVSDHLENSYLLIAHGENVVFVRSDGVVMTWNDSKGLSSPIDFVALNPPPDQPSDLLTREDPKILRPTAAAFNNSVYFANAWESGNLWQRVWKDSNFNFELGVPRPILVSLDSTSPYNDDYTAPAGGKFPKCRLVANHNGHMWAADIVDAGVRYPSRIRFSHPGQPEDWGTNDYFDVSPENERDSIRGLFSFRDELLVFKESGVYAVGGWDRFSFYQRKIAPNGGMCVSTGVDASAGVVYWISNQGNVFAYNGEQVVPVGEKINELWKTGQVGCSSRSIAVWARGSLYCSLDVDARSTARNVTQELFGKFQDGQFIFGPNDSLNEFEAEIAALSISEAEETTSSLDQTATLDGLFVAPEQPVADPGKLRYPAPIAGMYVYTPTRSGSPWTRHSFKPTSMLYWQRPNGNDKLLFTVEDVGALFDFMDETRQVDVVNGIVYPVRAYLKTNWADGKETATRKRWRRPRVTAAAEQPATLNVRAFRNYRYETAIRSMSARIGPEALPDQLVWDEEDWDEKKWVQNNDRYRFRRYGSAGSAHAVQFLFYSLDNTSAWWVDSIALPFRRRPIR
jgi:hypothetical protein